MPVRRAAPTPIALVALVALAQACSAASADAGPLGDADAAFLSTATDALRATETMVALGALPALAVESEEQLANIDVAANYLGLAGKYLSAGCSSVARDGYTLTYNLKNCDGPFGLAGANGKLDVYPSKAGSGSVTLFVKARDLTVDGKAAELSFTVVVTLKGKDRTLAWTGAYDVTGDAGKTAHTGTGSSTVDPASGCAQSTGTANTTFVTTLVTSELRAFKRCGDRTVCPTSGSFLAKSASASLEISYSGSKYLTVVGTDGKNHKTTVSCVPPG